MVLFLPQYWADSWKAVFRWYYLAKNHQFLGKAGSPRDVTG